MTEGQETDVRRYVEPFRVAPGSTVHLARDFDPAFKAKELDKDEGEEMLRQGVALLSEYQAKLAAQDTYGVLVILQALDAAGKDGTISHVMSGVNPQGVDVHSFKTPSPEELNHDYLWRYQRRLPERGRIGIFNRSHYEEVLVVRVHEQLLAEERLPEEERRRRDLWRSRYDDINNWERYLTNNGFRLVKLFLNLSKEEQRRRFLARIDEPDKNWKVSPADEREREYWDDYQSAYAEMLSATSTAWAPWYVVPSNHKWFGHVVTSAVIIHTLMAIDPRFPALTPEAIAGLRRLREKLEAEAPQETSA